MFTICQKLQLFQRETGYAAQMKVCFAICKTYVKGIKIHN